jgi:hypothetical protein
MPRITCKTPSSGRPLQITHVGVPTSFTTIADAPDFSVPDPGQAFPVRDPNDATRAIRAGEVFLLTPLAVYNKTTTARWIEVQLVTEAGVTVLSPGRVVVPALDTAYIAVQGRSLIKRSPSATAAANGDRLQVRADVASALDVWAAAEERLSAEHIGVV